MSVTTAKYAKEVYDHKTNHSDWMKTMGSQKGEILVH